MIADIVKQNFLSTVSTNLSLLKPKRKVDLCQFIFSKRIYVIFFFQKKFDILLLSHIESYGI